MVFLRAATRSFPAAAALVGAAATWSTLDQRHSPVGMALCEKAKSAPKQFQKATCTKTEQHTHDTKLITLKLDSDKNWNEGGPVANVAVRTEVDAKGEESGKKMITRSYNPISADSDNYVTLLVKRYGDKAQMGSALHNLKAGESVEVKCPNRQWKLPEKGSVQIYYMIAGGTGITPIHQATEGILQHDENARVVLLTLNKTEDDVLLKDELVALQKKSGDRLKVVHLTNYTCCSVKDAVSTVLPQASSWAAAKVPVKVMVCGRANMTAAICGPKTKDYKQGEVDGVLKEFGYTKDQVWKF